MQEHQRQRVQNVQVTRSGPQCSERSGTALVRCCKQTQLYHCKSSNQTSYHCKSSNQISYRCKSSNQTSTRIIPGPRGRWGRGPWDRGPEGPHAGPHHDGSHTRLRRPRRAGWCSSIIRSSPGHLQPLLQLQNRRLPTFCLLQVVRRLPLTIEALHTVGVGLELEPAVEVVLDALFALVMLRSTSVRGRICARTDTSLTPAARAGGRAEGGRYRRECAHLRHSRAGLAVCRRPTLLSHRTQVRLTESTTRRHQRRRRRVAGAELASVAINRSSGV